MGPCYCPEVFRGKLRYRHLTTKEGKRGEWISIEPRPLFIKLRDSLELPPP